MEEIKKKDFLFKNSVSLLLTAAVLSGFFYFLGFQNGQRQTTVKAVYKDNPVIQADFSLFWKVWDAFRANYLRSAKITDQEILYGAIAGIVDSAEDSYSVFLKPNDAQKFEEDLSGAFGGIGAEIDIRDGQLLIVAPLKDTPAERAGLQSGDKIVKVDETFSNVWTNVEEAVKHIRGPKGSTVTLAILRDDWQAPKEFSIVRDTIVVPTVDWEMKDKENKIAYLHLYNFNENAPLVFYKAVLPLIVNNPAGLILDLRNNPGGYLEVATNLAGWFLNRGEIVVKEEFSSGKIEIFQAEGNGVLAELPTVILVNQGSASASEILAGALRDNRGIKLIGETTFGKGTVQELKKFEDGSEMKITVAQWLLPKGDLIEKKGIKPDMEIKLTEEDIKAKRDPQLEKALEILREEVKKEKKSVFDF